MKTPYSLCVWHKNGVIVDETGRYSGKVYVNAKLADTKGKCEFVVICLDRPKKLKVKHL